MRLWWGVILSLLIHILLNIGINSIPMPQPLQKQSINIEILEKKDDSKKQVVKQLSLPKNLIADRTTDPLRFFAEKTQNVKMQTRAEKNGLSENKASLKTQNAPKKAVSSIKPDHIIIPKAKDYSYNTSLTSGISTIQQDLPDSIKIGNITALNTDAFVYYSFFNRSGDAVYLEWAPRIQNVLENPPSDLKTSIHNKFSSIIEVWFKPSGEFHSAHLMKKSGVDLFDQIAMDSFKRVKMFPNPPKEKIGRDGLIKFNWQLTVNYNPKVVVRQY